MGKNQVSYFLTHMVVVVVVVVVMMMMMMMMVVVVVVVVVVRKLSVVTLAMLGSRNQFTVSSVVFTPG